ncbi:hypothetical protein AAY473_011356 [Plecturocebus cupreus]
MEAPCPARGTGFHTTLVRLVLNSQPQVICPPWPPKCLDYRQTGSLAFPPGWSAVVRSELTAASHAWARALRLPQPVENGGVPPCSRADPQALRLPQALIHKCEVMGFHHIGQAGRELLTSGDPPTSAFQSVGIAGRTVARGTAQYGGVCPFKPVPQASETQEEGRRAKAVERRGSGVWKKTAWIKYPHTVYSGNAGRCR